MLRYVLSHKAGVSPGVWQRVFEHRRVFKLHVQLGIIQYLGNTALAAAIVSSDECSFDVE